MVRFIAALAVFLFAAGGTGIACFRPENVPEPTPDDLYSRSSLVFVGHVVGVEETQGKENSNDQFKSTFIAKIHVNDIMNGSIDQDVNISGYFYSYPYICDEI